MPLRGGALEVMGYWGAAASLAVQSLEQDVPRTDWDKMSQLHEDTGGPPVPPFF